MPRVPFSNSSSSLAIADGRPSTRAMPSPEVTTVPTSSRLDVSGCSSGRSGPGPPGSLRDGSSVLPSLAPCSRCRVVSACCCSSTRVDVSVPKSRRASSSRPATVPSIDLVAELDPDPAEDVRVDDLLDHDVAADLPGQRRLQPRRCSASSGRATRTVATHAGSSARRRGRRSPRSCGRRSARARPPPAGPAPPWPAPARPASRSLTRSCRSASGTERSAERVAQLRVGLDQPGEPEQLVLGLVQRRRPRSAASSWARTAWRSSAADERLAARPAHARRPRATTSTRRARTPCRRAAVRTSPGGAARTAPGSVSGAAQRDRGVERVDHGEQVAGDQALSRVSSSTVPTTLTLASALRSSAPSSASLQLGVASRHDSPAVLGSSAVLPSWRLEVGDEAVDRPTGALVVVEATRRRSGRRGWWPGHRSRCAAASSTWARSASQLGLGCARMRFASAWACSRISARIWLPWVLASSRMRAASLRASASCALYCSSAACGLGLGALGLLDAALDRLGALGVGLLEAAARRTWR